MLTDTHCHLYLEQFEADFGIVIQNALAAGVQKLLVPGLDVRTSEAAILLAEENPDIYAAVGVHPNSSEGWDDTTVDKLADLSKHEKVVAIGEIGLDYYWDTTPKGRQRKILDHQLNLAEKCNLPVVLHTRDSTEDLVSSLIHWHKRLVEIQSPMAARPGVVHSYSGDQDAANELIARNFFIGISGPVTFKKKAEELQELVRSLPLERILIETDSPYLSPHPRRGKRNEPSNVKLVAQKIADLRGVSIETVALATAENAAKLFAW